MMNYITSQNFSNFILPPFILDFGDINSNITILLVTTLILPLLGTLIIAIIPENRAYLIYQLGVFTAVLTFIVSLGVWLLFNNAVIQLQGVFYLPSLFTNGVYTFGVDGISLYFILLTTLLIPMCITIGWTSVKTNLKGYVLNFLVLEFLVLVVFTTSDLFLFYISFESVIIPMYLIIVNWGSRERKVHAAYMFFFYTLVGSILMLLALLLIYVETGTTDLHTLLSHEWDSSLQYFYWIAFFIAFAVKIPLIPFHIWLPEAHVEAPTGGSVFLAGVLLKLGTYGLLRFCLPLFPEPTYYFASYIQILSVVCIVYGSLLTIRQVDIKKIIAYSSVAHMGYVTLGLFALNPQGIEGSIYLMLSHGLVSSALFLCIGVLYERHHTRLIKYYGGVVQTMPIFAVFFLFFTLANISLPGTSSFVAEFLILLGSYQSNMVYTFFASLGVILGAVYGMWLYNRIVFGTFNKNLVNDLTDISLRDTIIFTILVALILWLGCYPDTFLQTLHPGVAFTLEQIDVLKSINN